MREPIYRSNHEDASSLDDGADILLNASRGSNLISLEELRLKRQEAQPPEWILSAINDLESSRPVSSRREMPLTRGEEVSLVVGKYSSNVTNYRLLEVPLRNTVPEQGAA